MAYLLDTDVFIRAKNLHYGFDFCPGFWAWLVVANQAGSVMTIDQVAAELMAGTDDLADWMRARAQEFTLPADEELLAALARVSEWIVGRNYRQSAVGLFFQAADYYLVAHGLAGGHTVVTHEVASGAVTRVKIPDVCLGLGVPCISPFRMLRSERARFVYSPA